MKVAIGNDHAGVEMKQEIKKYLEDKGYEVINFGTDKAERCDYPMYAKQVSEFVVSNKADAGILICGTGVGISIAANKVKGIRCAVCSEPYSAKLSKEHNNTNILAFGARVVGVDLAKMIVDSWINTKFEGERHKARINMISDMEC